MASTRKKHFCAKCPVWPGAINKSDLIAHQHQVHGGQKPAYPCKDCKAVFSSPTTRSRHVKVKHAGGCDKFPCGICHKTVRRWDNFERHGLKVHGIVFSVSSVYACKSHSCILTNSTARQLRQHRRRSGANNTRTRNRRVCRCLRSILRKSCITSSSPTDISGTIASVTICRALRGASAPTIRKSGP